MRQEVEWLFTYEVDCVQNDVVCGTTSYIFSVFELSCELKYNKANNANELDTKWGFGLH